VRPKRLLPFVAALAVLGAGCTSTDDGATSSPTAKAVPCPSDVELVILAPHDCGFLSVPEDRTDPDGPRVRLFYLHVEPTGDGPEPEPIASVGYEIAQAPSYAAIVTIAQNSNREFYLLDQRGTAHSEPSLACPEVDDRAAEMLAEPLVDGRDIFVEAVGACRERLVSEGVRPAAYTLAAAADDLEDLRQALGISTWNLISYGTSSRILLEYARRQTQGLRALVLDSPQLPELDPVSEAPSDLRDAVRALEETCSRSSGCGRSYPDLERALSEAASALDGLPVSVSVDGADVTVDGALLVRVVRHLLSDDLLKAWGTVPELVYRALDGDVRDVAAVAATDPGMCVGYLPRCTEPISLGTYLSFTCADVASRPEADEPFATAFGASDPYAAACRAWGIQPSAARAPVESDAPALVLRGEYDAFSPLGLVRGVTGGMPNAHIVLVPYFGHDVFGTYDCMRTARNTWLLHPESEPLYEECLRTIPKPRFEVP
jgi:pimeloyl-ACP methyl ester carboxylesterase